MSGFGRIAPRCARLDSKRVERFGDALHDLLQRPETKATLFEHVPTAQGWDAGGCGYLAVALKQWGGKNVKLRSIVSRELDLWYGGYHTVTNHVVVQIGSYIIDSNGAHPKSEFLYRYGRQEGAPDEHLRFAKTKGSAVRSDVCRWVPGAVPALAKAIETHLGPASNLCK